MGGIKREGQVVESRPREVGAVKINEQQPSVASNLDAKCRWTL